MSEVRSAFLFTTILNQKEFSVVTRALAGHELKEPDLALARDLNKRLLKQRLDQVREYMSQAERALEVAEEEMKEMSRKESEQ